MPQTIPGKQRFSLHVDGPQAGFIFQGLDIAVFVAPHFRNTAGMNPESDRFLPHAVLLYKQSSHIEKQLGLNQVAEGRMIRSGYNAAPFSKTFRSLQAGAGNRNAIRPEIEKESFNDRNGGAQARRPVFTGLIPIGQFAVFKNNRRIYSDKIRAEAGDLTTGFTRAPFVVPGQPHHHLQTDFITVSL